MKVTPAITVLYYLSAATGIVQSLFTPSELLVMSSRRPGSGNRMNKKKPRTADAAYQQLAECVLQYLHVVVCWDQSDSNNLSTRLLVNGYTFRLVYKACSYVDLYEPWGKDSYLDVAVRWLKDQSTPSWEEWIESDSQLEAVGSLAVHMHLTTNKQAGPVLSATLLSPATFIECLSISKTIALHIRKEEKVNFTAIPYSFKFTCFNTFPGFRDTQLFRELKENFVIKFL